MNISNITNRFLKFIKQFKKYILIGIMLALGRFSSGKLKNGEIMFFKKENFEESLKKGTDAELMYIDYINNHQEEYMIVKDVRHDFLYQKRDVDFIIDTPWEDDKQKIEVKLMKNDNLDLELFSQYSKWSSKISWSFGAGWLVKSKADYFVFSDPKKKKMFTIKSDMLREYYYKHNNQKNYLSVYFYEEHNKKKKNMLQRIPLADIEEYGELIDL